MSDIVARIANNIIKADLRENVIEARIDGAVINVSGASSLTKVAGENLSGHRAVCVKSDGKVYYADASDIATKGVLGVTQNAVSANENVTVMTYGQLSNVGGWTFTAGNPVFVTSNGQISSTVSGTAYVCAVGLAISADTINIEVQPTIIL